MRVGWVTLVISLGLLSLARASSRGLQAQLGAASGRATAVASGVTSTASATLVTENTPDRTSAVATANAEATAGRHIPAKAFTDVFVNVSATTAGFNRGGASSDGNVSQLSGIEATDTDGDLVISPVDLYSIWEHGVCSGNDCPPLSPPPAG